MNCLLDVFYNLLKTVQIKNILPEVMKTGNIRDPQIRREIENFVGLPSDYKETGFHMTL